MCLLKSDDLRIENALNFKLYEEKLNTMIICYKNQLGYQLQQNLLMGEMNYECENALNFNYMKKN